MGIWPTAAGRQCQVHSLQGLGRAVVRSAVLLCPVALVLSAPALAQTSPPGFQGGTVYGGGHIGKGASAWVHYVGMRVSSDRTVVRFSGRFYLRCSDLGSQRRSEVARTQEVALQSDGRFSGGGPYADAGPDGSHQGTWQFSGRFRGRDLATGTARFSGSLRRHDGRVLQCDSGTVHWTVRNPLRAPGTGALRRSAAYYGYVGRTATDPAPLILRVSRGARFVTGLGFAQAVSCEGSPPIVVDSFLSGFLIGRDRKFGGTASYVGSGTLGGQTERVTVTTSGRFTRRRVSGRLRIRARVLRGGQQIATCDSGRLTWAAERSGRARRRASR